MHEQLLICGRKDDELRSGHWSSRGLEHAHHLAWMALSRAEPVELTAAFRRVNTILFAPAVDISRPDHVALVVRAAWRVRVAAELAGVSEILLAPLSPTEARWPELVTAHNEVTTVFSESPVTLVQLGSQTSTARSVRPGPWWKQGWRACERGIQSLVSVTHDMLAAQPQHGLLRGAP